MDAVSVSGGGGADAVTTVPCSCNSSPEVPRKKGSGGRLGAHTDSDTRGAQQTHVEPCPSLVVRIPHKPRFLTSVTRTRVAPCGRRLLGARGSLHPLQSLTERERIRHAHIHKHGRQTTACYSCRTCSTIDTRWVSSKIPQEPHPCAVMRVGAPPSQLSTMHHARGCMGGRPSKHGR